jgi:ubiquinone biosynthesis protein
MMDIVSSSLWRPRDFSRLRKIGSVLIRNGLEDIVGRFGFLLRLRTLFLRKPKTEPIPLERRIRMTFEQLGPTFIKFGQVLATRPDLLPMSFLFELRNLHDHVAPMPFETARTVIEKELGKPIPQVFESLEETPVASASIAQVHRARLVSGEEVVVKVQRPDLPQIVASDLRILAYLADLLERRIPESRQFRPKALVEEFKHSLTRETDFTLEMASMLRYKENFKDEPDLVVPKPLQNLCTKKLLVMERVEGVKVTDKEALKALGVDLQKVVETGLRVTLRSIFEFGFFHADPHPGNFFVLKDNKIALLDFGMMGSIDQKRIDELLTYLVALVGKDVDKVMDVFLDADLIGDETDLRSLRRDLYSMLDRFGDAVLGNLDVSALVTESASVARKHHVILPVDLLLIGKSVATMEGIGREVYPEFKPLEAVRPIIAELYVKRVLDAKKHSEVVARSMFDILSLLKDAPFDIRRILRKLRRGEIQIRLCDQSLDVKEKAKDARVDRVVFACFLPIFFFGGVYLLEHDSLLHKTLSLVSFALSFFSFLGLLWNMLHSSERR